MKRRGLALLCALLLVFQLGMPPAEAAGDVYFLAAEVEVLPLSNSTMPFWSGGYLYIPSTMFTGSVRKSLDVTCITSNAGQTTILYNVNGRLVYERGKNYAVDPASGTYYPGMVERNGVAFVPAFQVANYFGLLYSVIEVEHGHLVWLRKPDFGLSDKDFANAATSNLLDRYNAYMKGSQTAPGPGEDADAPVTDDEPRPGAGKRVYLCLEAGEDTAAQLDALDVYGAQAAFFCTPEFLEEQGDLLRRMAATGQAIGILADAQDERRTVAEQLEAGNRALALATCGKTRLAYIRNGDEQALQAAQSAGFSCLTPDLDRTNYELRGTSSANALLSRVAARQGGVTVWLADTADGAGLRAFLLAAKKADDSCMALTETA